MSTIWDRILKSPLGSGRAYERLADAIAIAIAGGELQSGDRLPTQRDVVAKLGVAIGTVTRAYSELERRGLVVGKVGSGTYVSSFADVPGVVAQSSSRSIIDMTTSRPPPEGSAIHLANALRVLSKRRDIIDLLGTEPPNGSPRHRIMAARWIARRTQAVEPNQIVMCNGVQHALSTIFAALANIGDTIATEELNYPGIKLLADLHRINLVGVPMDENGIRADSLAELCRRLNVRFVLCSPTAHNPTTIMMSEERRTQLAALAGRYNFLIVENDILGMMPADQRLALRDLAPRRTIYVTGLSKVTAAGLRLGMIVAPGSLMQPLMSAVRSTTWMPQPLTLEIFSIWVENGSIDQIVHWHRQEITTRRAIAIDLLGSQRIRSDPSCYHLWLTLPASWTSDDFANEAYGQGVLLSPSDVFTIGSSLAPGAARISLGSPNSHDRLSRGLAVLGTLLREPRAPTERSVLLP